MQLVLNELSVSLDSKDYFKVNSVMDTFLTVYSQLVKSNPNLRTIISSIDINQLEITPGYFVSQWRNSSIEKDLKRRFLGLLDKIQIEFPSEDEIVCNTVDNLHSNGIQLAMEADNPMISFSFLNRWMLSQIECMVYRSDDDSITKEYLRNFSTSENVQQNRAWLLTRHNQELSEIKTPIQLIEKMSLVFPSLHFTEIALRQIRRELTPVTIPIVTEKLFQLESYFSNWDGQLFDSEAFPSRTVSPQSQETLKRFKKEHTFFYNHQEIIVSYHMRYTGGIPGRIYFYPDHSLRTCIICSLTTKLPTVSDPKLNI